MTSFKWPCKCMFGVIALSQNRRSTRLQKWRSKASAKGRSLVLLDKVCFQKMSTGKHKMSPALKMITGENYTIIQSKLG